MSNQNSNSKNRPSGRPADLGVEEDNVVAIVGFVLAFVIPPAGLICSIIGFKAGKRTGSQRGLAIAGIVVSAVFLSLQVLATVFAVVFSYSLVSTVNRVFDNHYLGDISLLRRQLDQQADSGHELPTDKEGLRAAILGAAFDLDWEIKDGLGDERMVIYIAEKADALPNKSSPLPANDVIHLIIGAECASDYPDVDGGYYPAGGAGVVKPAPADSFAIVGPLHRDGGSLICVDNRVETMPDS